MRSLSVISSDSCIHDKRYTARGLSEKNPEKMEGGGDPYFIQEKRSASSLSLFVFPSVRPSSLGLSLTLSHSSKSACICHQSDPKQERLPTQMPPQNKKIVQNCKPTQKWVQMKSLPDLPVYGNKSVICTHTNKFLNNKNLNQSNKIVQICVLPFFTEQPRRHECTPPKSENPNFLFFETLTQ